MELIWKVDENSQDIAKLIAIIDGQKNNALFITKSTSGYSSMPYIGFDFVRPLDISFEEIRLSLNDKYDDVLSEDEYKELELAYVQDIMKEDFENQVKKILY